jgi:hypothetical protein
LLRIRCAISDLQFSPTHFFFVPLCSDHATC